MVPSTLGTMKNFKSSIAIYRMVETISSTRPELRIIADELQPSSSSLSNLMGHSLSPPMHSFRNGVNRATQSCQGTLEDISKCTKTSSILFSSKIKEMAMRCHISSRIKDMFNQRQAHGLKLDNLSSRARPRRLNYGISSVKEHSEPAHAAEPVSSIENLRARSCTA